MILEMRAVRSAGGQFGPDLSCEPNGFSGGQSSAVTHMDVCVCMKMKITGPSLR